MRCCLYTSTGTYVSIHIIMFFLGIPLLIFFTNHYFNQSFFLLLIFFMYSLSCSYRSIEILKQHPWFAVMFVKDGSTAYVIASGCCQHILVAYLGRSMFDFLFFYFFWTLIMQHDLSLYLPAQITFFFTCHIVILLKKKLN